MWQSQSPVRMIGKSPHESQTLLNEDSYCFTQETVFHINIYVQNDCPLFLYPRSTEAGMGAYWIHPEVCLSVRPSVCPSVDKVSGTYLEND